MITDTVTLSVLAWGAVTACVIAALMICDWCSRNKCGGGK